MNITKLSPHIGAEVTGVDLTAPLDAETRAALNSALADNVALVIRDQKFDASQFYEASILFGEPASSLRESKEKADAKNNIPHAPFVHQISSHDRNPDGSVKKTGPMWHTDMSGASSPPKYTALHALEVFRTGGDGTSIANTRAAFEALPKDFRERLDGLQTAHTVAGPEPVLFPLVRTNPDSGKKGIYFVPHRADYIVGMTPEASHDLFEELLAHILKPEFIYQHDWSVGDMLIWDNRCALHRANYDYDPTDMTQQRLMYRILIKGEQPH